MPLSAPAGPTPAAMDADRYISLFASVTEHDPRFEQDFKISHATQVQCALIMVRSQYIDVPKGPEYYRLGAVIAELERRLAAAGAAGMTRTVLDAAYKSDARLGRTLLTLLVQEHFLQSTGRFGLSIPDMNHLQSNYVLACIARRIGLQPLSGSAVSDDEAMRDALLVELYRLTCGASGSIANARAFFSGGILYHFESVSIR